MPLENDVTPNMDAIFHEKQEGSLCAQHCLNALLQGEYFTAVELASLARELDEEEMKRMAEGGVTSPEYLKFLEQPSGNMDDSGFFSVQVISSALTVWGLELEPYCSDQIAAGSNLDLGLVKAFICNYREHWFTVRKLGHQWFNLNSLLTGPELISDTYLSMFLAQLQQEGYSIFLVLGNLPECEADQVLQVVKATQTERPKLLSELRKESNEASTSGASSSASSSRGVNMDDLQKALAANRQYLDTDEETEEEQLREAIRLSMQGITEAEDIEDTQKEVDIDEMRRKRQEYFSRQQQQQEQKSKPQEEEKHRSDSSEALQAEFLSEDGSSLESQDSQSDRTSQEIHVSDRDNEERKPVSDMTEEEMLQAALELSMKTET
ncbi:ataxin-3-like [Ptychodera flava]|uniref:ataxin-3-like n=1 Tax=Ptychodera flava TaxID=63121 RepID=UPI003969CF9F